MKTPNYTVQFQKHTRLIKRNKIDDFITDNIKSNYYINCMKEQDVSEVNINDSSRVKPDTIKTSQPEFQFDPIDDLELQLDRNNPQDREELTMILRGFFDYPSEKLAEFHYDAMRLGNFDLSSSNKKLHDSVQLKALSKLAEESKVCGCCGFIQQKESIPMCTPLQNIANIGTSTNLFFATFRNLSILLVIMTVVYSIYSLITNIIAAKNNAKGSSYTVDYLTISLSSKESNDTTLNRTFFYIEAWLGMVTVIIWIFIFLFNRYREFKESQEYDDSSKTVSDYSILMEGMPMDVTEDELQKSLNSYFQILNAKKIPENSKKELKIRKLSIGKPFFLNEEELRDKELEEIIKQIEQKRKLVKEWVIQRRSRSTFSQSKQKREETYKRLQELQKKKIEKSEELSNTLAKKLKEEKTEDLTTIFISFETNVARNLILTYNDLSFFSRLRAICGDESKYSLQRGDRFFTPHIEKAPEPEDIIWPNIGRSDCNTRLRKLLIYTITGVLLGICFLIVYYLSKAQQSQGNNRTLSIAISIIITGVNVALGVLIKQLTQFQKDYTSTNRQASLAIKSIIAQMINSILTPVITAYYIKTDTGVYQTGGLVDNIFMMGITNSLLPPIIVLLDPFVIWVKTLRCFKTRKSGKLSLTQRDLNVLYEGIQFQVGAEYIYIVNLFMFVCFFVSLQPIVSVFALLGYLIMYWSEKYCLFNRYKRPVPGSDFVNKSVYQLIFLGPLIYSFGSLTWANFDPNGIPPEAIVPNLLAVLFSVLVIILPMNTFIEGFCTNENTVVKLTNYDNDRMFFSSEYDRVNPTTSRDAITQLREFREKKAIEISKLPKEQQQEIAQKQALQAQRGALNKAKPPAFGGVASNYYQQPYSYGYSPYYPPQMPAYSAVQIAPQMQAMPMQMQSMPMQMPMGGYNPYGGYGYQQQPQQQAYNPYGGYGGYGGYNPYGGYGGYRY